MAYSLTRNKLFELAVIKCGVDFNSLTSTQIERVEDAYNAMINHWQNLRLLLFQQEWVQETLTASSEVTGTDGQIYTCYRSHTSSTATRPVTGANWTSYWYLAGSTGGTWNDATAYTAIGNVALDSDAFDYVDCFVRYNGVDTPVELIGQDAYAAKMEKHYTSETPSECWIHKTATNYTAYLYPQPNNTDAVLHFSKVTNLTETETNSDALDASKPHYHALIWNLADAIALDFSTNPLRMERIEARARQTFAEMTSGRINRESVTGGRLRGAY